jgi:hypothetical protein
MSVDRNTVEVVGQNGSRKLQCLQAPARWRRGRLVPYTRHTFTIMSVSTEYRNGSLATKTDREARCESKR